jgi:predicted DNA-binding protein
MAKKVTKAVRLPKDVAERVDDFAERQEISEADALRRLIRSGLDSGGDLITRNANIMDLKSILAITLIFLTIEIGAMFV